MLIEITNPHGWYAEYKNHRFHVNQEGDYYKVSRNENPDLIDEPIKVEHTKIIEY